MTQRRTPRAILAAAPGLIPLRGQTGRLWGMYDPQTQIVEFRHGTQVDRIDLSAYHTRPRPPKKG